MRLLLIALSLYLVACPERAVAVETASESRWVVQDGPPKDPKATRAADLVELVRLDPTLKLDIRYAGANNFLGKPVYKEARALDIAFSSISPPAR